MAFQGKKFINKPNDVVTEYIEGLVETYPGLQYLDGFSQKQLMRLAIQLGELWVERVESSYGKLKANGQSVITSKQWAEALEASISAISKYGGAAAGYCTMLDALIPAAAVLQERLSAGIDPSTAFLLSSKAALAGAESTKHMQAQILASVPDPGAMAAAGWYRAAALAVKDK